MESEELPPGWAWASLDELGYWTGGGTPSKANPDYWQDGTVPWVSPKDMKKPYVGQCADKISAAAALSSATKMVPSGSILCVIRSGILKHTFPVALADCDLTINQDMRALTVNSELSAAYINFFLQARNSYILHTCSKDGTTVASIELRHLQDLSIPIAPAPEQQRIATAIETLFGKLDEAEVALARARYGLEQFRASLLHAACTGQLTAAWREANPPAETGADLLRRILTERRAAWERAERARLEARGILPRGDRWKERYEEPREPDLTGMPDLPDGWAWASLDQLALSSSYGTSVKCDTKPEGIAVLRIPNVQTGAINWQKLKYATIDLGLDNEALLNSGDLLVVRTNGSSDLVGRAGLIESSPNIPCYFASYLIRFRLTGTPVVQKWIATTFASGLLRLQVDRHAATSAGQYNISQTNLAKFAIPLPPELEIMAAIYALNELPGSSEDWLSNEAIASLRQSVLHAAFTGQLVPQDPADEPADELLARLRAATTPTHRARRHTSAEAT